MTSKATLYGRRWAEVLLAFGLFAGAAAAQQAERPDVKAGDRWSFVVYYDVPSAAPNRIWVVGAVTPGGILATENELPLTMTLELNVIDSPLVVQTNPRNLRFPLRVGDKWTYSSDARFKDNGSTAHSDFEVSVLAYEKVRVVAGEFDAFKLTSKSRFTGASRGGPGKLEGEALLTYWYAPSVRAIVKTQSQNPYRGKATSELVEFRPGP